MVQRKTNKGQIIDFEALMAQNSPALGNMRVDAEGNTLGPNGEIIEKREDRVRAYYKDHPQSSTAQASLKGNQQQLDNIEETNSIVEEPKTAKTAKENKRTAIKPDTEKQPEPAPPEGETFDEQEPLGFKEVELPNGDIEMVPYYTEDENEDKGV